MSKTAKVLQAKAEEAAVVNRHVTVPCQCAPPGSAAPKPTRQCTLRVHILSHKVCLPAFRRELLSRLTSGSRDQDCSVLESLTDTVLICTSCLRR